MSHLPRIALGTLGEAVDARPMLAAVLAGMQAQGWQSQLFCSQARHQACSLPRAVTGRCPGYLDSWLMSRASLCRAFAETAYGADVAVVTGAFEAGDAPLPAAFRGGSLAAACQWLHLPRVAIVSARAISLGYLPARPAPLAGFLVDGAGSPRQFAALQKQLEQTYRAPVLGYLPELPALRAALERTRGGSAALADMAYRFSRSLVLTRGWRALRGMIQAHAQAHPALEAAGTCEALRPGGEGKLQVAVAYDEAFHNYFPAALDALEAGGATVRTFSPLSDEALPEGTDLVILSAGRLDAHVARLARNPCLLQSLRRYVAEGGRVYAEGGGMAYLSEHIALPGGETWPMVGALPLAARLAGAAGTAPREVITSATCWLARRGTLLRGYREGDWEFASRGPLLEIAGSRREGGLVVGRQNVIGSRLQLHFAALPVLLENLLSMATPHLQSAEF